MGIDLQQVQQLCCEVAVLAGEKIMEIYVDESAFENVQYKADNSPLTMADTAANAIIVKALAEQYPECAILSEEGKDDLARRANRYCFVVDPLDGTKEFIKRNGQFTVNIALVEDGRPVVGVIYVPVTQDLYYAAKGYGSHCKNLASGVDAALAVSDKLTDLIWVGSKSHSSEKEQGMIDAHADVIADVKAAGSSLKGCMVAKGEADIYYRFGLTCEWDTAAMQCVTEQAGAIFRQMDGSEMLYNRENTLNEKGFFIVNHSDNIWI